MNEPGRTDPAADLAPKLCLPCARRKLGGRPVPPCGTCILLNVDPLAVVRANTARRMTFELYMPINVTETIPLSERRIYSSWKRGGS